MYKRVNSEILNIYNEPIKPCGNPSMGQGSWDSNFLCSEKNGGVHQICVKSIGSNTNKFSMNTGQSDWSSDRKNNNHCVCLGAWSLYNFKKNNNIIQDTNTKKLICDAIPNYSLTKNYIKGFMNQGWEIWNGLEQNNQIIDGVHSMVHECFNSGNINQKLNLKNNYCNFAKDIDSLNSTHFFKEMCK